MTERTAAERLRALADQLEKGGGGQDVLAANRELATMLGISGIPATQQSPAQQPVHEAKSVQKIPDGPEASKLPRAAQLQLRQLRWLLKTRLSQARSFYGHV